MRQRSTDMMFDVPHRVARDGKRYPLSDFYARFADAMRAANVVSACREAACYVEATDDPNGWMLYGQTLLTLGDPMAARAAFRTGVPRAVQPFVSDVIHAAIGHTVAVVDDRMKLLYVPIPKCGSTTVKAYLAKAVYGVAVELQAHEQMIPYQRLINLADLDTAYSDYFKFTVVRPAEDRVHSYVTGNIVPGLLRANSWNLPSLRSLGTSPSAAQFYDELERYRMVFPDVRHHTDPLDGYLGDPDRFDVVYTMEGLDHVRQLLQDTYHVALDEHAKMSSSAKPDRPRLTEWMTGLYANESVYFQDAP